MAKFRGRFPASWLIGKIRPFPVTHDGDELVIHMAATHQTATIEK
ncbi:MAG: hypothetical protein ACXV8Q_05320 [Methylobacter sp.]